MGWGASKRANERMSTAERASEASSAEQANEWAMRANEWMAQYSTRRLHTILTHCALARWTLSARSEVSERGSDRPGVQAGIPERAKV